MNTKIITTNEYDKFSFYNTNRVINYAHVRRIMDSIQLCGQLEEITCNEDWRISDGQHRFYACKKLNLPIRVKVRQGASSDDIIPTNIVRRGWTISDYINHYAKKGNNNYKILEQIIEENKGTKLGVSSIMIIYNKLNTHLKPTTLRLGDYKIDVDQGNFIRNIMLDVGSYIPIYGTSAKFVRPMNRLIRKTPNLNIERLKNQLKKHKVHVYPNEQDTYREFVEVYNLRLADKNRI